MRHTLAPGDEIEVGPFGLMIVYDGPIPIQSLHLAIVHRVEHPRAPVAETYTRFQKPIGLLLIDGG